VLTPAYGRVSLTRWVCTSLLYYPRLQAPVLDKEGCINNNNHAKMIILTDICWRTDRLDIRLQPVPSLLFTSLSRSVADLQGLDT
jgi:hypothetical protein